MSEQKFDIGQRSAAEAERYVNKPLSASFSRTFMPHGLSAQEPPRSQASLFASPEPRTEERPPCEHVGTEREDQTRLDGGRDVICGNCGAVVESGG